MMFITENVSGKVYPFQSYFLFINFAKLLLRTLMLLCDLEHEYLY